MSRKPRDPTRAHRNRQEATKSAKPKRSRTPNQIALQKAKQAARKGPNPIFLALCREAGVPEPECELRFKDGRKWAFDYAWPEGKVALEVEGGVFTGGRHTRGAGFLRDMDKYNAAALLGWVVVRTVPRKLAKPATVRMVRDLLALRAAPTCSAQSTDRAA